MRKIPLIIVSCLILVGGAYALISNLFPDNSFLPRVPTGAGTIGGTLVKILGWADLSSYLSDGTVTNSEKLDGISASGYLKDASACNIGEKWLGIDSTGNPNCGGATTLYADYGKIESQGCDATLYHASGSSDMSSTGQTLKSGDIVKTASGCQMTIVFDDLSVLRLDGDTTVSLDIGYTATGGTMASAILANGSLWGRILTETGSYSIGTDTVIAGVRGTSLSLVSTGYIVSVYPISMGSGWTVYKSPSPNDTEVTVVDTTATTGASVLCKDASGNYISLTDLHSEQSHLIPPTGCTKTTPAIITSTSPMMISKSPLLSSASINFASSAWIRENTKKDLTYLYSLRATSGASLDPLKNTIIDAEIATTKPAQMGSILTASGIVEAINLCNPGERWWNERYGCQDINVLAIADYTLPEIGANIGTIPHIDIYIGTGSIYSISTASGGSPTVLPGQGVYIGTGQFLMYPMSLIGGFSGKTITISIDGLPPTLSTLLDFSFTTYRVRKTPSAYQCVWSNPACNLTMSPSNTISLIIPPSGDMTIGNNQNNFGAGVYTTSINATIRRIQISN